MKVVTLFAVCSLIPTLAYAQGTPTAAPAAQPGYPPGHYAPPPGYYGPPPGYSYPTQPPPPTANLTGFTFAVGLGYGQGFGDVIKSTSGGVALSDAISGHLPISASVGYRATPMVSFGLATQYAPAFVKNCDPGASCSASDFRLGGEIRIHLQPEQSFSPWFSAGLGWERFNLSESGSYAADMTLTGMDVDLQFGGDIRVSPFLTLGPYIGLRFGSYSHLELSSSSLSGDADIPSDSQSSHGWFAFGIRGAFTFASN